ncbi:MAG: hypothetical protein UY29_C0009G0045 [Parcubacteria group bacterium GW2011_GWC2_48_17]|nr:MAG: hypothetical protein UY29_C0009G0045 [Parcubacteria group bacterium GW2011_GWC2_48_17]
MDPELKRKIQRLQGYFNDLSPYLDMDTDALLGNKEKLASMERFFQLMADEAFDTNSAIAYELGNEIPESNRSTFIVLSDLGVLERNFAEKIAGSAGVRNAIIHDYEKLQKKKLIEDIKKFVELYKEYIKILINRFVQEK